MIAFVMLSNKSQYILSKIGIPIFEDAQNPSQSGEIIIHFYKKDNILTLHAISVDEYTEKEIKLLEAIIGAVQGSTEPASQGIIAAMPTEPIQPDQLPKSSVDVKATLVFSDQINIAKDLEPIQSPSLQGMISDPSLKKELWSKLKPLTLT
ncbi:MAG: hypothetical protein P8L73_05710 [SAR86 cluster bacterium]|jgi:hypothetical protein|nr:hypothetical protein [Gammaproteobacteria bacterium]MDG1061939.1 hypothetical protein [SAR86 cluster bacterium]MDG2347649.1 hypothetical protein [SAR86 cluster bacterium]|tara:strand:+ start:2278 stop:2730 length:453 start_codon:yes stop_codon:yes gene_type:complete